MAELAPVIDSEELNEPRCWLRRPERVFTVSKRAAERTEARAEAAGWEQPLPAGPGLTLAPRGAPGALRLAVGRFWSPWFLPPSDRYWEHLLL